MQREQGRLPGSGQVLADGGRTVRSQQCAGRVHGLHGGSASCTPWQEAAAAGTDRGWTALELASADREMLLDYRVHANTGPAVFRQAPERAESWSLGLCPSRSP